MTQKYLNETHVKHTKGGLSGHILRRVFHVSIIVVPFIYYAYGGSIALWFGLTAKSLLWAVIALNIILEGLRLKFGWTVFGQRLRETKNISAFAWGVFSICIVLLLSPEPCFAIPIIAACAIADPLLGELRRTPLPHALVILIGIVVVMLIWFAGSFWLKTPWQLALLMGPLTVALEWRNFRWIDDNALMQLVPLFVIMLVYG